MRVSLYKRAGRPPRSVLLLTPSEREAIGEPYRITIYQVSQNVFAVRPAKKGDGLSSGLTYCRYASGIGYYRAEYVGEDKIPFAKRRPAFGLSPIVSTLVKKPKGLRMVLSPQWIAAAKSYRPNKEKRGRGDELPIQTALVLDDRELDSAPAPLEGALVSLISKSVDLANRPQAEVSTTDWPNGPQAALASLVLDLNREIAEQGARVWIKEDGQIAVAIPTWKEV